MVVLSLARSVGDEADGQTGAEVTEELPGGGRVLKGHTAHTVTGAGGGAGNKGIFPQRVPAHLSMIAVEWSLARRRVLSIRTCETGRRGGRPVVGEIAELLLLSEQPAHTRH
jgi:hypothetical protein